MKTFLGWPAAQKFQRSALRRPAFRRPAFRRPVLRQSALGWLAGILVVAGMALALPALALTLEEARTAGLIGEQADGYVGAVSASPEVTALVQEINRKRLEHYRGIAAKNNLEVDKVARLAGEKLIEKAAPGEMIRDNGGWKKK